MSRMSWHLLGCTVIAAGLLACGGGGGGSGSPGGAPAYSVAAPVLFPVNAREAVWDAQRQVLYLSLPSSAGPNGNRVVALDPRTNTLVRSQFVGSEPSALALSDDGQYLYVGVDGSAHVRRLRLPDLTLDLNIPLPIDDFSGPQHAVDLQVMPGAPRSVVVALGYFSPAQSTSSTVLYDDAVARPLALSATTDCICGSLQWGADASRLYAANNQTTGFDFYDIEVDASGLRVAKSVPGTFSNFNALIHYSPTNRLLYSDDGTVFDPAAARKVGMVNARGPMVPDPSRNRLYFATAVGTSKISAFDSATFQPADVERPFSDDTGLAASLVRWGSDGLALVASGGSVHLFGGAGTASFSAAVPEGTVSRTLIRGAINRLAWDAVGGRLYASVSGASAESPGSLLAIDPQTGSVVATKAIGNEPNALAVSDDGQFLYVGLDGAGTVQRLRLPSLDLDVTLSLGIHPQFGPYVAGNLKARPGAPRTVAVSRLSLGVFPPETGGLQVFDDAVPRPVSAPALDLFAGQRLYNDVDWNPAGTRIYSSSLYGDLHVLNLQTDGVHHERTQRAVFGALGRLQVDRSDGLLYNDSGRVVDPDTGRPLGTFVTALGAHTMAVDAASNRVFTLVSDLARARIRQLDKRAFTPQRSYSVPFESGLPTRLSLVGSQHLAFVTAEGLHLVRLDPP